MPAGISCSNPGSERGDIINGPHRINYSKHPEGDGAFCNDSLHFRHVDVACGRLILGLCGRPK